MRAWLNTSKDTSKDARCQDGDGQPHIDGAGAKLHKMAVQNDDLFKPKIDDPVKSRECRVNQNSEKTINVDKSEREQSQISES